MLVVAVTDRPTSPIARDAWGVLSIPMESPHYLPSLVACQAACEALLAAMVSLSGRPAIDNVTSFEDRVRRVGGYVRSEEHTSELQSLMRTSYAVFCLKKKTKNT